MPPRRDYFAFLTAASGFQHKGPEFLGAVPKLPPRRHHGANGGGDRVGGDHAFHRLVAIAAIGLYSRLKDWCDDDPDAIFHLAVADTQFKELCMQVLGAAECFISGC